MADKPSPAELAAVQRCLALLARAAAEPDFLPPMPLPGGDREPALQDPMQPLPPQQRSSSAAAAAAAADAAAPAEQQTNLVATLGALRELSHMYAPLEVLGHAGLTETLGKLKAHQVGAHSLMGGGLSGAAWA